MQNAGLQQDKRETFIHSVTAVINIYLLINTGTISSTPFLETDCMHDCFQHSQVGIIVYMHTCLFAHVLPHPSQ